MKKMILSLLAAASLLTATAQQKPAIPRDEQMEQKIEQWLKKMTLDEKVGQMCELTIDVIQKRVNPFMGIQPNQVTPQFLKKLVKQYKLEKEFDVKKLEPSQEVMMRLYMRIQEIENAKGFQAELQAEFPEMEIKSEGLEALEVKKAALEKEVLKDKVEAGVVFTLIYGSFIFIGVAIVNDEMK